MDQRDLIIEKIRKILELEELKADVAKKINQDENFLNQSQISHGDNSGYEKIFKKKLFKYFTEPKLLEIKYAKENLLSLKRKKNIAKFFRIFFSIIIFGTMAYPLAGLMSGSGLIWMLLCGILFGISMSMCVYKLLENLIFKVSARYEHAKQLSEELTDEELNEKLKSIVFDKAYDIHKLELMQEEKNNYGSLEDIVEVQDIPLLQVQYSEMEKLIATEKRELLLMGYPAYRDLETYLEEYEISFAPEPEYYPWVTSSVSNLKLIPGTQKFPNTYKKR